MIEMFRTNLQIYMTQWPGKAGKGVGGGVLPRMDYIRRLCPEGVPVSGFICIERWGFHTLRYMKR